MKQQERFVLAKHLTVGDLKMKSSLFVLVAFLVVGEATAQYRPYRPSSAPQCTPDLSDLLIRRPLSHNKELPKLERSKIIGLSPLEIPSEATLENGRLEKISNRVLAQRVWINGVKQYKMAMLKGKEDMEKLRAMHGDLLRKREIYYAARGKDSPLYILYGDKSKLSPIQFESTRVELEHKLAMRAIHIQAEVEIIYPGVMWERDEKGRIVRPIFHGPR